MTSMSVMLFAVAEAIARCGLPEPRSVTVTARGPVITTASTADQDKWAKALRLGAEELARPLRAWPSERRASRVLSGMWHGVEVLLYYSTEEPAEVAA
jgi:hypothetical protein